ncbi:hypothetical protein PCC7424_5363 (plasmid) [Gloeothece citriformis PCC 7424]|uniref:Uncharacterized protein n=1 Tax=Gloeothece citriformis (strain PCC 7424) TaxID=65393 RepID=B7KMC4_GLOC7|nr:hypothetical protein [Gloeothece citriformis]ACK73946.1 hypothetical protein PCC7424_5363 [Gloeothece citriformis PCC 7424]
MEEKLKKLISDISSKIQHFILRWYGYFDEEGNYHHQKQIPLIVVRIFQKLGKLVALVP